MICPCLFKQCFLLVSYLSSLRKCYSHQAQNSWEYHLGRFWPSNKTLSLKQCQEIINAWVSKQSYSQRKATPLTSTNFDWEKHREASVSNWEKPRRTTAMFGVLDDKQESWLLQTHVMQTQPDVSFENTHLIRKSCGTSFGEHFQTNAPSTLVCDSGHDNCELRHSQAIPLNLFRWAIAQVFVGW